MQNAILEAKKCTKDVPIGCVIKKEGKIILAVNDYILRSSPDLQKYKNSAVPTPFYERTVILNREL